MARNQRRNTLGWYKCPDRCINARLHSEDHQPWLENVYRPDFPTKGALELRSLFSSEHTISSSFELDINASQACYVSFYYLSDKDLQKPESRVHLMFLTDSVFLLPFKLTGDLQSETGSAKYSLRTLAERFH